jgi:hypothetical protein
LEEFDTSLLVPIVNNDKDNGYQGA